MYAPLKKKEAKKVKENSKTVSIEGGIPDVPQISDFNLTEFFASSSPKSEINDFKECDLENAINELDLEEDKNEEKEEEEKNVVSNLQIDNKKESVISVDIKNTIENETLSDVEHAQVKNTEKWSEDANILSTELSLEESICTFVPEEKGNNVTQVNDYYNLSTTVKNLIAEVQKPTALTVEGDIMSSGYLKTSQQFQDEPLSKEKAVDFSKYNFTLVVKDFLIPFSDEKLSEFYYNLELHDGKNCVKEFIFQEINNQKMGNNNLYKLLVAYIQSRNYLKSNELKIEELRKKLKICTSTMWTVWDDVKVTEKEQCSDKNTITFVETYTQAQFNTNIFEEFTSLLTQVKNTVYQTHIMGSFTCAILKLKIEYYLQNLLTSCPEFTNMEEESPPILYSSCLNSHFQSCLSDLKMAISILFIFQRKQTFDIDNIFLQESREWLSDLVAVLLRVGSWKDHIFILNHVMRCPGGVSEWAASFIQLPFSGIASDPFNNTELNHMMTVMNILLSPIEQREEFLKKWESELGDVNPWIVIDSDGEPEDDEQHSSPLKENDLVSFLNQIPFANLFRAVLKYDERKITTIYFSLDYLLKLFSFFTDMIKILHSGLHLYSSQRYRQFAKRLGRLIYHLVQYATDALIVFKSQKISEHEMLRIQVEYDSFFFKSAKFIYSAKKHGTWQFLATIPYNLPSYNAILKLYGILQLNDDNKETVVKVNFSTFEEKFSELPEEEQFYLLTTFANMALARSTIEIQFIKNILLQLFYIGFLSPTTMDHCHKNVRSLLCSICSSHPSLMSEILYIQKNMFISKSDLDQKLSTYLWIKLPVDIWQPTRTDIETLSMWLSEPIHTVQNELARIILQSLNYGIIEGKLFISPENHLMIAQMVLESNIKLVLESDAGVIQNVSNLVGFQNPLQMLNDWTWNILLKLRLHLLDQSEAEICKCLYNIGDYLRSIPDVESKIELHHLVLKKHPVAIYIALMSTTLGHSVPIIFDKGFELVDVLLNAGKYEAGVACLEYMTLMFLDCSDSLYKCEKFIFLLSRLIAADNSYVQFAKNLISNNYPGPVLKCLESMVQNQINCCRSFNKFSDIMQLWLLSLTKIPLWMQEPGVLYLIDKLLENSFFNSPSTKIINTVLEELSQDNSPSSETKSSFSSLVSWMNSKYSPPSLLSKGYNGEVPWFSYKIIQMEFDNYEKKTMIWDELIKEMFSSRDKKANVDNSLKKVCSNLKIPVRPSSVLAIYKWSYQLLETDMSHPLVPLMWQTFFSLYLYRVPGLTDRGSVGIKFFEGVINQSLFKRLKQRLQETCDHFKILSEQTEDVEHDNFLRYYKLFQAYLLWLDDPRLLEPRLSIHILPIQYNPELLGHLINRNEAPWIQYLDYQKMEQNFKNGSTTWLRLKNRYVNERGNKIVSHKKEKSTAHKMADRLNSYEVSVSPPRVNIKKNVFPRVNIDILLNSDKMNLHVKPYVKLIFDFMQQYTSGVAQNVSLGCDLQELLPRLYFTKEIQRTLKKHCNGISKTINGKTTHYSCSGPAVVKLTYEESTINEQAKQLFVQCEKAFDDNLQKALASLPPSLISSAVLIDIIIEELKKEFHLACNRGGESKVVGNLKETGVHLFYDFVKTWCESVTHTPLLDKVFENYVEVLGKTFIEGNSEENDRILHLILNDDMFGEKICKYFTPNASSAYDFIENYSKVLHCTSKRQYVILLKFDLVCWLSKNKPKFSDGSRIISIICRGLKSTSGSTEEKNVIQLLNQHLEILLMYDFPEHYGEILNFLIEGSESQKIPTSSWFTFLNSLASGQCVFAEGQNDHQVFEPGQSVKKLKYCFSKFATSQNLIPFDVITGTISLLASTFKEERLKVGIYGLYRKFRLYVEPLFIFFGMLSYSSVAKALEIDTGSLSEKITQQLCPLINDLYSPWLVPYWVENGKIQSPQWNQDRNSVFFPWSTSDSCYASFCASIFTESIRFLFDALPGDNRILSYTWFFYVTNFGNVHVKDYIFNVIHDSLLSLPWDTFTPSLQDVELMVKVVDQFLPLSHSFLGNIFVNIKWSELVRYYLSYYDVDTTTKLHICLLHLLVKLPLEPSLKQNEKVVTLLTEAKDYAWHLVDSCSYDMVLNWFIMSCDPRIILMDERLEYYKLDSTIFKLLQASAGYISSAKLFHSTTTTKRLMFAKACIKWLITSNRRFKSKDSPLFKSALFTMWTEMETIISETVPLQQRTDEAGVLLSEFLVIFSEPDLSTVVEVTFCNWLSTRSSQVVIFGIFRAAGVSLDNPNVYGSIVESSLENYFNLSESCDWSEITNVLVSFSKSKSDAHLQKILAENNCFLTLYAILLKKFYRSEIGCNSNSVLTDLLHLFSEVKLNTDIEPKLILLIVFGLRLTENEIKYNLKQGISYLVKFSDVLNNFLNDKGNGFFSAIGLKKSTSSNKFKLICLTVCSGITFFLKNNYPEHEESVNDKILQALESAESNRVYQSISQYASYAKAAVKEMKTVEQIINFLKHIGLKLFNKLYLK